MGCELLALGLILPPLCFPLHVEKLYQRGDKLSFKGIMMEVASTATELLVKLSARSPNSGINSSSGVTWMVSNSVNNNMLTPSEGGVEADLLFLGREGSSSLVLTFDGTVPTAAVGSPGWSAAVLPTVGPTAAVGSSPGSSSPGVS